MIPILVMLLVILLFVLLSAVIIYVISDYRQRIVDLEGQVCRLTDTLLVKNGDQPIFQVATALEPSEGWWDVKSSAPPIVIKDPD